mmetsp:Transcript_20811/g.67000  ORF Transcript_20811/g.67000 Transcript_20811/m.67000 type:complete len:244 (-) Transcript_20811:460-1191(-)
MAIGEGEPGAQSLAVIGRPGEVGGPVVDGGSEDAASLILRGEGGDDGDGVGAGAEDVGGGVARDATDGDEGGVFWDEGAPGFDVAEAAGSEGHGLRVGAEDRSDGDVGGSEGEGDGEFGGGMGGNAEAEARGGECVQVGIAREDVLEIFLSEVDAEGPAVDRGAPVVVHPEARASVTGRGLDGVGDLPCDLRRRRALDAQLDVPDASLEEVSRALRRLRQRVESHRRLFVANVVVVVQVGEAP